MSTPTSPTTAANPAAAFYAGSTTAQAISAALRLIGRVSPRWGTRAALRVFFTPLPWKFAMRRRLPHAWQVSRWPFEGSTLTVYRRTDIAADRPAVLLVHGWAGGALQMHGLGDALADAGYAPVLVDLPAHGRSGGWRSTLPQFARALFALTARTGPWHGIVAHSLGTLAALHAAARGLPVQRLALVAPPAPPALFIDWFARSFGLPAALAPRMREQIERREGTPLAEFEPRWLGPRIAQPALVVHDRGDRVAPFALGERLAGALPGATLYATDGLGHRRVLDDAGVAAQVVAFFGTDTRGAIDGAGAA